jgi:hypothetical protein
LSIREIAAQHGITDTAIRKRAARDGWARDLSKRIQDKAEALVRTAEVRSQVRTESANSDRLIVEANGEGYAQC